MDKLLLNLGVTFGAVAAIGFLFQSELPNEFIIISRMSLMCALCVNLIQYLRIKKIKNGYF